MYRTKHKSNNTVKTEKPDRINHRKVSGIEQNVPIIFITGVAVGDDDRLKGYSAGGVDYLLKPVVPEILCAKVQVFARLHQLQVERQERIEDLKTVNQALMTAMDERKRAEDALCQSENAALKNNALLRSIMESPQDVSIFALDTSYRYTTFTQAHRKTMKKNWGVEIEVGMNMLDVISNLIDREKARRNFDRALEGKCFTEVEEYGDPRFHRSIYENRYGPVYGDGGVVSGLTVFVVDIIERKQAEAALQRAARAAEQLRSCLVVINNCPDFNSAVDCLLQKVIGVGGMDCAALYFFEGQEAVLRQQIGLAPDFVAQVARRPLTTGYIKAALENPHEIINVIERFTEQNQLGKAYGLRHVYCIALMAGDQPFGFLNVVSRRFVPPSDSDIEFIRILALETGSVFLRLKVEEQLRRANIKQRIILNTTPAAVFYVKDRKVQWVNPAFGRILGYTDAESVGLETASLYASIEQYECVGRAGYEQLSKGESYSTEVEMKRKDGSLFWASIAGRSVDPQNQVEGSIWILNDITERKRMLEAIQESEIRQRSILTTMAEGVIVQNADGSITDCNLSTEKILGLSRDDIMGRTSIDPRWQSVRTDGSAFPGEDHPAMASLRTGQACHDVLMGLHLPDGSKRWININTEPMVKNGETRPYAVITSFADITARRLMEEELQASEERYRSLYAESKDAIMVLSPDKGFISGNPAAIKFRPQ